MNTIPNINSHIKPARDRDQDAPAKQNHSEPSRLSGTSSSEDRAEISRDWTQQIDWTEAAYNTIEHLLQSFPKVTISVRESAGGIGDLAEIAAQLGAGAHVILSQDFLERMSSSQEEYEACKSILTKILLQLSADAKDNTASGVYIEADGATFWTSAAKDENNSPTSSAESQYQCLQSMLNKFKEQKDRAEQSISHSVSTSYKTAYMYTKLAAASDKMGVRAALSEAQRKIGILRTAAVYGTDQDRMKARAAVSSLQKLLMRGNQKLHKLTEADLMKMQKKRAEKKEEMQKAMRLQAEMRRRESAMHSRNWALVNEGRMNDWYVQWRSKHSEYDPYEGLPDGLVSPAAAPDIAPVSGIGGAGVSFTASEVIVSDKVAF